jgi:hypothetical protein
MKKFYPYILSLISIFFSIIIFDYLKLPYNENNIIQGTALIKRINPYDNVVKVYFFIFFPLAIFLITYLLSNNVQGVIPFKKNFFLNLHNCKSNIFQLKKKKINIFTLFFIFVLVLEFLFLDFNILLSPIDIYHDGLILVPSYNSFFFKNYWISSYFDYGIAANLRPLLIWKIIGLETIGAARFLDQFIILFNKVIIIFICRKISFFYNRDNTYKLIFFFLLSISSVHLSSYFASLHSTGGSPFSLRTVFFLIFFLFVLYNFEKKNIYIKNFLLGFFSPLSFLWYNDFAFYTNTILFFFILLLFFTKNYIKIFIILSGVIISWFIFLSFFGIDELKEFFFQIKSNIKFIYYFNFLEFPKPFSEDYGSSRGTKSLLLIIINGIICLYFCLNKKKQSTFEIKMLMIITFLSSIVLFKSALIRSDIYHIRYASGFIFFLFFLNFNYILLNKLELKTQILNFINTNKNFYFIALSFLFFIFLVSKNNFDVLQRIKSFKENVKIVLYKNDSHYLSFKPEMWNYGRKYSTLDFDEDKKFIEYYKNLTREDKCIQNFTEYLVLSYFLKKPTCTKFYNPQFIQHNINDYNFIIELKKNSPNYILYSSPIIHLDKFGNLQQDNLMKGIPNVEKFINENYLFYESYLDKWVIYKKKLN